jgi:hypothetical protein
MVSWYDPAVLFRSGLRAMLARLFGRHSDRRLIEALGSQPQSAFDYSKQAERDFWFDYVADVGDGWNSTYAIAYWLSQPGLALRTQRDDVEESTRGGRVLIFGGDEVYPYPARQAYELGTEKPYAMAFAAREQRPDVFAIPGNHDWYDSLVAFSRTFCRPERGFAACRTQQTRSYFALRLPHHWWVLGADLQLGDDLDEPQVQYFQRVAEALEQDARIILCVPEPQWIYERSVQEDPSPDVAAMRFLEKNILKRRISVFIAGDLHCYRRHEAPDGVQKIVCGAGGAFLRPTHTMQGRLIDGSEQRTVYPPAATSRGIAWRNLLFPFLNPRFFWIPAALYTLSVWFAFTNPDMQAAVQAGTALRAALEQAARDPVDGLWLLLFVGAFVAFTDTHVRWYRIGGGMVHAITHLLLAFAIGWAALQTVALVLGLPPGSLRQWVTALTLTFVASGVAGSWLIGLYLLVSLQLFGRHDQHAFSSLRVQDYKGWMRMRIDATGTLSLYAIGVERVPRRWKDANKTDAALVEPDDPSSTAPHLIERIVISGSGVVAA